VRAFWDALAAGIDHLTLAGWIQIISAIGAVAAAVAAASAARAGRAAARTAAKQLPELQQQIQISAAQSKAADEQVALTQDVLKTATAAVREAARARTDERAPLVVALFEAPRWPPLIDSTRSRMAYGNEDERAEAASPTRLFARGERTQLMFFQVRGVLINEGATTARVRLDEEAQFVGAAAARRERLLRPGEVAQFEWGAGHTIAEWAAAREQPDPPNPLGACFLTITVFDSFEHGVFDHIHVVMSGQPVVPVDDTFDEVRLASREAEAQMAVTVFPTRRNYRSDGARRDPLPWDGTYAAWWKANGRRVPGPKAPLH
jgi:hypothetical protein